jgi:hypothetical protein
VNAVFVDNVSKRAGNKIKSSQRLVDSILNAGALVLDSEAACGSLFCTYLTRITIEMKITFNCVIDCSIRIVAKHVKVNATAMTKLMITVCLGMEFTLMIRSLRWSNGVIDIADRLLYRMTIVNECNCG